MGDAIALSPDGAHAYVANYTDDALDIIDTATGAVSTVALPANGDPLGVAATSSAVYVGLAVDNELATVATSTDTVTATTPLASEPTGIATNGNQLVVDLFAGPVDIFGLPSGASAPTGPVAVPGGDRLAYVAVDGTTAYVADRNGDELETITGLAGTQPTATFAYSGSAPYGVAVSPDGSDIVTTNSATNNFTFFPSNSIATGGYPGATYNTPAGTDPDAVAIATPPGSATSDIYIADQTADGTLTTIQLG